MKEIYPGRGNLTLSQVAAVARYGASVVLEEEYLLRVHQGHERLRTLIAEGRPIYGVNTGLGDLCHIHTDTTASEGRDEHGFQRNILRSHAVSVGAPLSREQVRAMMVLALQNLGTGHSGVRTAVVEQYARALNSGFTPCVPGDGSVGYLAPEAHLALALIGEGRAWAGEQLLPAAEALRACGMTPLRLEKKEALAMISGTTSVTALAALALYDLWQSAEQADEIAAMSVAHLGGSSAAYDERLMSIRPHREQGKVAATLRDRLSAERVTRDAPLQGDRLGDARLQDALSLRCIPQLHGGAREMLRYAGKVVEVELNSCCDNPVIWGGDGEELCALSGCNADGSYVGIAMDGCVIAAANLAKMSERRTARLMEGRYTGLSDFLAKTPGQDNGLMICQYTQAGLLNELRILAHPATTDNTPTSNGQEDYVSMGYTAAKKAARAAEKLRYILAIELLANLQAGRLGGEAFDRVEEGKDCGAAAFDRTEEERDCGAAAFDRAAAAALIAEDPADRSYSDEIEKLSAFLKSAKKG